MLQTTNGHSQQNYSDISPDSCINNNTHDEAVISHCTTININQSQSISINGSSIMMNNNAAEVHNIITETSAVIDSLDSLKLDEDGLFLNSFEGKEQAPEIDDSNVNFNQNREQWQRRASSQTHIKVPHMLKMNRRSETWLQRQNHTPDLVMDLPLVGSSSPKETTKMPVSGSTDLYSDDADDDSVSVKSVESPTGPESPDMTTAAERFAKQNQCTLKKNTKIHNETGSCTVISRPISDLVAISSPVGERKYNTLPESASSTTTFKPVLKSKPPVLKKPVFSVALSTAPQEILQNDQSDVT